MSQTRLISNYDLRELRDSEYEIVDGEPDIRNWKVIADGNLEIGKVPELLFDEFSQRVRYIIVEINGKPLNLISRSVLVPIGLAELLRDEKLVLISGLTLNHLATLPDYEKGKLNRETEYAVRNVFIPAEGTFYPGDELYQRDSFYDHAHFNYGGTRLVHPENTQKTSLKTEIRENIERVKESVRKMEDDLEKLGK